MNQQIKFRAWNPDTKQIIYPKDGDILTVTASGEVEYWFGGFTKCEIQWFTGLKDENGKEIYEGDVLGGFVLKGGEAYPVGVYWNNDMAAFCITDHKGLPLGSWSPEHTQIIGNIYENPDLLKA